MLSFLIHAAEKAIIPDFLIRLGIRNLCRERLNSLKNSEPIEEYIQKLISLEIPAIETQAANEQHYEVPPDFFKLIMGKHLKYSSCYWNKGVSDLSVAEQTALEISAKNADLADGMKILELGCGWGSFTLFMAQKFPNSEIVGVSNSAPQRMYITEQAELRGLKNIKIITTDLAVTEKLGEGLDHFDRVVSIEMFEHFRNYEVLLKKISNWLKKDGKLFVHIFSHKSAPYLFETEGDDNWMGKYFFTGGQMPSHDLLKHFNKDMICVFDEVWNGVHYQKTSDAWLKNCDSNRLEILKIFEKVYGSGESHLMYQRWRIFFMAVSELFGYKNGTEWAVSHYLFKKR